MLSFSLIFLILFLLGELWLKIAFQYFKGFLTQHIIELRAVTSNPSFVCVFAPCLCLSVCILKRKKKGKKKKILQHKIIGTLTD